MSRIERWRQAPDTALVDQLEKLVSTAASAVDCGEDCGAQIAEINRLAGGRDYSSSTFFELYGAMSERDFAEIAARGMPPIVDDLTREELSEIIRLASSGGGPEVSYFVELLNRNFPYSWSSDLIFWPHREMSNGEIVDELLLRQELYKTGGPEAVRDRQVAIAQEVLDNPEAPVWAKIGAKGVLRKR